jgi:hypothetical protein
MRRVFLVLWTIFGLGLLPYLCWLVALQLDERAVLVGPYLLVSPLIALSFGAIFAWLMRGTWSRGERSAQYPVSENLTTRARLLAEEASVSEVEVRLYEDPNASLTLHVSDGVIYANLATWRKMPSEAQDFALARNIASLEAQGRVHVLQAIWKYAIIGVCAVIAALNPWTILAIHATTGVMIVARGKQIALKSALQNDRRALQLTKDLKGAFAYLDFEAKRDPDPWQMIDQRKAALQA